MRKQWLQRVPFWNIGGTLDQLNPPNELPEGHVLESVNWKHHPEGRGRIKRPGYAEYDANFPDPEEPIVQIHEFTDSNGFKRTVIITKTKIYMSKEVSALSRVYLEGTTVPDSGGLSSEINALVEYKGKFVTYDQVDSTHVRLLYTEDGENWEVLYSGSSPNLAAGTEDGDCMAVFNDSIFIGLYNTMAGQPRVLEWDGTAWVEHTLGGNYHSVGFKLWDGKLWLLTYVTPSSNNKWHVRYYDGSSWSSIDNYDGDSNIDSGQNVTWNDYNHRFGRLFVWNNDLYLLVSVYNSSLTNWTWQVWRFKAGTYDQFEKVYDSGDDSETYALSSVMEYKGRAYVIGSKLDPTSSHYPDGNQQRLYESTDMITWTVAKSSLEIGFPVAETLFNDRFYLLTGWETNNYRKFYHFDVNTNQFILRNTISTELSGRGSGGALLPFNGSLYVGKHKEIYKRTVSENSWSVVHESEEVVEDPPAKVDWDGRLAVSGFGGVNLVVEGENTYQLGINPPSFAPTVAAASGAITGEKIADANGTDKEFTYETVKTPIKAGSVTISYTIGSSPYTASDDGENGISGDYCTGFIDYASGYLTLTFDTAPDNSTTINMDYTAGMVGKYKYLVTFYRKGNYPCESNPSPESAEVTMDYQKGSLSNIPVSPDSKVNARRIYRTQANGATFYWLADIDDNSTTTFSDHFHDDELGDEVSYDRLPPPKGTMFEVWDNRLWIAGNPEYPNLLFFTNTGTAEEWASTNFLNIRRRESDTIRQIKAFGDVLYAFKTDSMFKVEKRGTSLYEQNQLPQNIGTDAPHSVAVCDMYLIFKSKFGVEIYNGERCYRPVVSEFIRTTIASIDQKQLNRCIGGHNMVEHEYWLALPDHKIVVFDYLNRKFAIYEFADGVSHFASIVNLDNQMVHLVGTPDGNLFIQGDYYADSGKPINGRWRTGWVNVTGENGIWNVLRRMFLNYILPFKRTKTGELIGAGDGAETDFTHTALNLPVNENSVTIHYIISAAPYTATDDGNGNISGTNCTGTVDYTTGAISLTFSSAPDSDTNITLDYETDLKLTLNIYKNFEKTAAVSLDLAGVTPTSDVELRNEILRRINLGVHGYHVSFEFINNQDTGGECRVVGWDAYFRRALWKHSAEAD